MMRGCVFGRVARVLTDTQLQLILDVLPNNCRLLLMVI